MIKHRLLLPFDYLLLLVSYLFPRNKKIWCFGSEFFGNTKYLFIHMSNSQKNIRCIWITEPRNVKKIKDLGYEVYDRWSLKGVWFCLIAGVYLYNSYPSNVNLYTMGRAKLVNLWHGIALKRCDRQITVGPKAKIYQSKGLINRLRYLNFRIHPDIVLSTAPVVTDNYSEAFGVGKERFIEGMYPRCALLTQQLSDVSSFVNQYESEETKKIVKQLGNYDYVYVYMPTFRDSGDNFILNSDFDFQEVNKVLKSNNRALLLKLHPDSQLQLNSNLENIIMLDKNVDIYPILPFTHCLITDYSSIYFDYMLMKGKQIILFTPDKSDYISKSRELVYDYDKVVVGRNATNFTQLLELLGMSNPFFTIDGIDDVRKKFWQHEIDTIDQLVEEIKNRINY